MAKHFLPICRIVFFLCIMAAEVTGQAVVPCDFLTSDKELNRVYTVILKEYTVDTIFLRQLKEAQRAWVTFRDKHVSSRFPVAKGTSALNVYGSSYDMCACAELVELTNARIQQLKRWLVGTQEGDACSGSYHIKE